MLRPYSPGKVIPKNKRSSLFCGGIGDAGKKKFHNTDTWSIMLLNTLSLFFTNVRNKLERLSLASISSLVLCLQGRAQATQ